MPRGPLSQAWTRCQDTKALTEYLLLDQQSPEFLALLHGSMLQSDPLNLTIRSEQDIDLFQMVMEFCGSETARILEKLDEMAKDKTKKSYPAGLIRLISLFCAVNDRLRGFADIKSMKWQEFSQNAEKLSDLIIEDLNKVGCEQAKIDAVLISIVGIIPNVTDVSEFVQPFHHPKETTSFLTKVSKTLEIHRQRQSNPTLLGSLDPMDMDDVFESQSSQVLNQVSSVERNFYGMMSETSYRSSLGIILMLVAFYFEPENSTTSSLAFNATGISLKVTHHLCQLTSTDLVNSWDKTVSRFLSTITLQENDLMSLLDYLTDAFLTDYTLEYHEVALGILIDLLTITAGNWTASTSGVIMPAAADPYEWFINIGIKNSLLSEYVMKKLVDLFFGVLRLQGPEFTTSSKVLSVKDVILELLNESTELPVRAYLAEKVPLIFEHFTLHEHERNFQTIFERLLVETGWTEGMAVRLRFLSSMASRWNTLLRRSVYSLFESAGRVGETQKYAAYCISHICSKLQIPDEMELFRSFAPQLLYTWLKENSWETIPFTTFKYTSLQALLNDVEDEAVAQALTQPEDDSLKSLAACLGKSLGDILVVNFGRAVSYCFAVDSQRRASNNGKNQYETRLKTFIDSRTYVDLLQAHYPLIISILFATLKSDEESSLLKLLSKDPATNTSVATTLSEIRNLSSSATQPTVDQQPTFRPHYLLDNIHRLCRRIGRPTNSLWTESLFVFVLRFLLQRIQPSLGSFHTGSILRKVRLLVAFSGNVAMSGYPLEILLHSIRPFLVDHWVSEDAIGIIQYLLNSGVAHLPERVPFVAGYVVGSLVSLRKFCNTTHTDSTTQEADYLSTLSKAGAFRTWLYESWFPRYCTAFESLMKDDYQLDQLQLLVHTAAKAEPTALLQAILFDQKTEEPLLPASVRDDVLRLLCLDFKSPVSYREDFLGSDSESAQYAMQLWEICHGPINLTDNFLLWASKAIGRAQNSTHRLELSSSSVLSPSIYTISNNERNFADHQSTQLILNTVVGVLMGSDRNETAFAEQTLRFIFSHDKARSKIETHVGVSIPDAYPRALKISTKDTPIPYPQITVARVDENLIPQDLTFWLRDILLMLAFDAKNDLLKSLHILIGGIPRLSIDLFPPILHLHLLEERASRSGESALKLYFSALFNSFFQNFNTSRVDVGKALIRTLLYLREQPLGKVSILESLQWLDLDYVRVSRAAEACGNHTAALLFAESIPVLNPSQIRSHGRGHQSIKVATPLLLPEDLLLSIYENIDEPDSFYGVHKSSSLDSVLNRLEYENDGHKSLLFYGARLDSEMRQHKPASTMDSSGVFNALSELNLNSLALALLQSNTSGGGQSINLNRMLQSARKLEQWDINAPEENTGDSTILFKLFQGIAAASDLNRVNESVNSAMLIQLKLALQKELGTKGFRAALRTLGVLTEIDEVFSSRNVEQLYDASARMESRNSSLLEVQSGTSTLLLSARETLFSIVANNKGIQNALRIIERDARSLQITTLCASYKVASRQSSSSTLLATATYLHDLMPICQDLELDVEPVVLDIVSDVLWSQGEHTASIKMLESLAQVNNEVSNRNSPGPKMLAKLGHHIAEARLENPAEITRKYLEPALQGLHGRYAGEDAGQVLHQFAVFCDKQLHNSDFIEELERVSKARDKRKREVDAYHTLIKATKGKPERDKYAREYKMSKKWLELDDEEYGRMAAVRETQIVQCFENYLRSLVASEQFNEDALRLFSIWIEFEDNQVANQVVAEHLPNVPSAKFAILMNQLTSILQDSKTRFHKTLSQLIKRICIDHPFHALHHIYAGVNATSNGDEKAQSRKAAIISISGQLQGDKSFRDIFQRVFKANQIYHALAIYKDKSKGLQAGLQVNLTSLSPSATLVQKVPPLQLPPPTINIPLRADGDYSDVPHIVGFKPRMSIASGISAPKIVTALGSDGESYRQLVSTPRHEEF
jgi:serine-protein kinase ATM